MTKLIICGFPGVGKSTFAEKHGIEDSDSSRWKENFPKDYVDHLETLDGIILVSTHKEVRDELTKRGLNYIIVAPEYSLKDIYIKNYENRGSPQAFIDLLDSQWESFHKSIYADKAVKVFLDEDEYLENTFPFIVNMYLTHLPFYTNIFKSLWGKVKSKK